MTTSVIIPTCDRPRRLLTCVRSVLNQSRPPDEVVIVDDASSCSYDEARRVLADWNREKATQIDYHRLRERRGGGGVRNAGAQRACGDVLMFVDDDDTWQPTKIERQVNILKRRPDVGLVYAGRRVVNESGQLLYHLSPSVEGSVYHEMLQANHVGTTSSVAVRAGVFHRAGGFDENLLAMQDYDLWIRVAQIAPFAYDAEHTVNWTVHTCAKAQMAGQPGLYVRAFQHFLQKYADDIERLSFRQRRKMTARHYSIIADKYARSSSGGKQYAYALRSVAQYPTWAGLSRFIPFRTWMWLRTTFDV